MPYIMNDRPKPRPFLTDWFPPGVEPVRDGVYLTAMNARFGRAESWHAMRWDGETRAWFSAGSSGNSRSDLIGYDKGNRRHFFWRGLAQEPQP
jgi:hypothetical protein